MLVTKRQGTFMELTIPDLWNGLTIAEIFKVKWNAPKKLVHDFRMSGRVKIRGEKAGWETPLAAGDKIHIGLFIESPPLLEPFCKEIDILYEDDHLLIVNKPPFMNTHPNKEGDHDTLLNAMAYHLQMTGEGASLQHVHRLDRDTTGAILFAKHPLAGAILGRMLEERTIHRTYIAGVHGTVLKNNGTIEEPIGRDRHHPTRRRVSATGQAARTNYKVLKVDRSAKLTWIACWLDTGRTHQIRVHFSHIGHPLAGDPLYGGKPIFPRQALHSAKLAFPHPITFKNIEVKAPFLDDPPIFNGLDLDKI
ncbi:RluA family pseudouridine synthase [Neobacillus notoginsengisoli]|uniref:Pseudouridine synthase n=1 Tax=Neobacillus notoginsengisoli TaxID=1578198 RepID=A0A417YKW0_9BACI|nr:RluA family pseudouridine synthase [Neobacillus notoginsengisoli]RHW34126.1 RluA family pseudouridine synthase [Neobacillus notoginsengisoli]